MAQNSLCGKLSTEMELKISGDKYFEHFISPQATAKSCPKAINKVDLVEGQWGKQGCVILWHSLVDGKIATSKVCMTVIDHKNKRAEYNVIGGSILEGFESYKFILDNVTPKDNGCFVRWSLEFEKKNDNTPEPTVMINLLNYMSSCIEAYLS
ncbi:hypothetical protein ACFE04_013341 [Oxalis oulophora]